jgi:type IV pilus assembly protein PilB
MLQNKFMDYLAEKNLFSRREYSALIKESRTSKTDLAALIISKGFLSEEQYYQALAAYLGIQFLLAEEVSALADFDRIVPARIAWKNSIVPVTLAGESDVYLASYEPIPEPLLENLRRVSRLPIQPAVMPRSGIELLLNKSYPENTEAGGALEAAVADASIEQSVQTVDRLLLQAIAQRASDIHMEPEEDGLHIRFRIDGTLRNIEAIPPAAALPVISRLKVLSNMNIADKRSAQDGGFQFDKTETHGICINLRASTLPCISGEKMVLRLLPTENTILSLERLGMEPDIRQEFSRLLDLPHGIIFVTGPTGSGKTNTLYSALKQLRSDEINITTVEDPIELKMRGINQTQADRVNRFTFQKALKSILRQDPNIIMVGEVRDGETAALALEAALTGHLVLSTLHTNDSTSALGRLLDMGCEPFLITASIRAVLAQRLVRVICRHCKEKYHPADDELKTLGLDPETNRDLYFYRGRGCASCNHNGYRGRTGIFELFILDKDTRKYIATGSNAASIREYAVSRGMRTLRQDGLIKIREGITTTTEIIKATTER